MLPGHWYLILAGIGGSLAGALLAGGVPGAPLAQQAGELNTVQRSET